MPFDQTALLTSKAAQRGVGDQFGNTLVDPTIEAPSTAIDPRVAEFILYGVLNGGFARGPLDPNSNLEFENNPLPDWSGPTQVSGGQITCSWAADSSSPSGRNLRFTIPAGTAGDDAYMEQIVYIGGVRSRVFSCLQLTDVRRVVATDNGFLPYCDANWLKSDGTVTGSLFGGSNTFVSDGLLLNLSNDGGTASIAPSDAQFVRLRLGVRRNTAAAGATGTFDFVNTRLIRSALGYLQIPDLGAVNAPALIDYSAAGLLIISALNVSIGTILTASGSVCFTGIISPSIGATQNNWAPTGLATCAAIDVTVSAAAVHITGFSATGFTNGQTFRINPVTNDLILDHASASSTSGNRIACPGAANFTIRAGGGVWMVYDASLSSANPFRVIAP